MVCAWGRARLSMSAPVMTFPIGEAILRSAAWPVIGALHIVGFVMLVGAVTIFDLRVLGFARTLPVRALARLCLPWAVLALLLIVPTGSLQFMAHADVLLDSRLFLLKMGLLLLAAIMAIAFHAGPYGSVMQWNTEVAAPVTARLLAATSILIWIAVLFAGRMLTAG
jgi:hypothetical protein